MKFLLDQNLPRSLLSLFEPLFPGSRHVRDLGWERLSDETLWTRARAQGYAILSKDLDFLELATLHGTPPRVVLVRGGNMSTTTLRVLLWDALPRLLEWSASDLAVLELAGA